MVFMSVRELHAKELHFDVTFEQGDLDYKGYVISKLEMKNKVNADTPEIFSLYIRDCITYSDGSVLGFHLRSRVLIDSCFAYKDTICRVKSITDKELVAIDSGNASGNLCCNIDSSIQFNNGSRIVVDNIEFPETHQAENNAKELKSQPRIKVTIFDINEDLKSAYIDENGSLEIPVTSDKKYSLIVKKIYKSEIKYNSYALLTITKVR